MFPSWLPALVLALAAFSPPPATAETPAAASVTVTAGAVTVLDIAGDIRTVVVAAPEIADATVTAPRKLFLLGRKIGRTGLLVIGTDGAPLLETTVMVAPSDVGLVTVDRGTKQTTLSCTPRCSESDGGKPAQDGASASQGSAAPAGGAGLAPSVTPSLQPGH